MQKCKVRCRTELVFGLHCPSCTIIIVVVVDIGRGASTFNTQIKAVFQILNFLFVLHKSAQAECGFKPLLIVGDKRIFKINIGPINCRYMAKAWCKVPFI